MVHSYIGMVHGCIGMVHSYYRHGPQLYKYGPQLYKYDLQVTNVAKKMSCSNNAYCTCQLNKYRVINKFDL